MNAQITTAVLVLGVVQLSRKLDLENPDTVNMVRVVYGISQALLLVVMYLIKMKIDAAPNKTIIEYEESTPSLSQPTGGQKKRMTIQEYDLQEWQSQFKQTLIPIAMIVGLHLYGGFTQPLIIQSILPWKALYSTPLVQIYLLGKRAEGPNARPYKKPNPLEGLIPTPPAPQQEAVTDGTTAEQTPTGDEAEKSEESSGSQSPQPKTRKRPPRDT